MSISEIFSRLRDGWVTVQGPGRCVDLPLLGPGSTGDGIRRSILQAALCVGDCATVIGRMPPESLERSVYGSVRYRGSNLSAGTAGPIAYQNMFIPRGGRPAPSQSAVPISAISVMHFSKKRPFSAPGNLILMVQGPGGRGQCNLALRGRVGDLTLLEEALLRYAAPNAGECAAVIGNMPPEELTDAVQRSMRPRSPLHVGTASQIAVLGRVPAGAPRSCSAIPVLRLGSWAVVAIGIGLALAAGNALLEG